MRFFNLTILLVLLLLYTNTKAQHTTIKKSGKADTTWTLVFSDEFNNNGAFDPNKWSYCPRANPAWAKFLTCSPAYACVDGHNLVLRMDSSITADPIPYHAGGVQTSGKFSLLYGKVEVRAKFNMGKGSWPAIWMMPEKPTAYGPWPNSGEIDIMEHVNNESVIHHTIHNSSVTQADGASSATCTAPFNQTGFNIYGITWAPEQIQFYVNEKLYYTYKKPTDASAQQWPFNQPFYLILNQSGGAGWPGAICKADLPFIMTVDWVRIYQLKTSVTPTHGKTKR